MCVLKIVTFSLWCTRLLASLVCRYGQKVTVIKKWVSYMPGKGGKWKITTSNIKKFFKLEWECRDGIKSKGDKIMTACTQSTVI